MKMNTLQAEKLRDLIAFLEKQGVLGIKITSFTDYNDCISIEIKFDIWKKVK
jgi:hypothetical protein